MTNLLAGEWVGDEWTAEGNGLSGINRVQIIGAEDVELQDDGLLAVTAAADTTVSVWAAGTSSPLSGEIPNNLREAHDTRIAFMADVDLDTAELESYVAGADGFGQPQSQRSGHIQLDTLPANELVDIRTESTLNAVIRENRAGKLRLIFTAAEDGTVLIAAPFYGLADDVPEETEWPGEDEDGGGSVPIPEDEVAEFLAPRVAAYIGKRTEEKVQQIAGQLPVIIQFVNGYTRGRGFDAEGYPNAALRACIVSAAARVAANPQQLRQYSLGDYSASPALLTGFTLIEQRTLNNYRRMWA